MTLKKYNCLIVDDEPIARKIVFNYVNQLPNLECVGKLKNAIEALDILSKDHSIDIVFLDINMPNLSGISMVKILNKQPKIIFTTAYSEYAIDSYEINAVDYLLKPFSFERFTKAVFKAIDLIDKPSTPNSITANSDTSLFVKSEGKNFPVNINDILFCEAKKNYTKIVMKNEASYLPLMALSKFEIELNELGADFIRIHRSFIVAKKEIGAIATNHIELGKHNIPIGDQYKEDFLKKMGLNKNQ
jgi:DNA-binding LytR/AlgR family response regulator